MLDAGHVERLPLAPGAVDLAVHPGPPADLAAAAWAPFDLERGPVARLDLWRVAEQTHVLLGAVHHVASDGPSMRVLAGDLARLYAGQSLPPLAVDWDDAVERLRTLPRPAPGGLGPRRTGGRAVSVPIGEGEARRWRRLAARLGVTLATLLQATFRAWAWRLTGEERCAVPMVGRTRQEWDVVGYFTEAIDVPLEPRGPQTFAALVGAVDLATRAARRHPRPAAGTAVLFNMLPEVPALELPGLQATPLPLPHPAGQAGVALTVRREGQALALDFTASEPRWAKWLDTWCASFQTLLGQLERDASKTLASLALVEGTDQAEDDHQDAPREDTLERQEPDQATVRAAAVEAGTEFTPFPTTPVESGTPAPSSPVNVARHLAPSPTEVLERGPVAEDSTGFAESGAPAPSSARSAARPVAAPPVQALGVATQEPPPQATPSPLPTCTARATFPPRGSPSGPQHDAGRPLREPLLERLARWSDGGPPLHLDLERELAARLAEAPTAPAITDLATGETWSRAHLDAVVSAAALRLEGLPQQGVIALDLDRSPRAIALLLACLRTGNAWWFPAGAPLEAMHPVARVSLEPDPAVRPDGAGPSGPRLCVEPLSGRPLNGLAFALLTSGTTGEPRPVRLRRPGLEAYVAWFRRELGLRAADRVLQFQALSFDGHVEEILPALCAGATLVLRGRRPDARGWVDLLARERLTVTSVPTGFFNAALPAADRLGLHFPATLRACVVGGEALSAAALDAFRRRAPGARLLNTYGPSEATIAVAFSADTRLGRPIPGARVEVVDDAGHLVPPGVVGTLRLGGAGLAEGEGSTLRPGDLAAWDDEGQLEFHGRADTQVKWKGLRFEPTVVEQTLEAAGAAPCLVRLHQGFLVAWASGCEAETLRSLISRLPPGQRPSRFAVVPSWPLTAHGKTDVAAVLAVPTQPVALPSRSAGTPEERVACQAFATVLRCEVVGLDDDFFELGGDSLLGLELCAHLEAALRRPVSLEELELRRTPAALLAGDGHGVPPRERPGAEPTSAPPRQPGSSARSEEGDAILAGAAQPQGGAPARLFGEANAMRSTSERREHTAQAPLSGEAGTILAAAHQPLGVANAMRAASDVRAHTAPALLSGGAGSILATADQPHGVALAPLSCEANAMQAASEKSERTARTPLPPGAGTILAAADQPLGAALARLFGDANAMQATTPTNEPAAALGSDEARSSQGRPSPCPEGSAVGRSSLASPETVGRGAHMAALEGAPRPVAVPGAQPAVAREVPLPVASSAPGERARGTLPGANPLGDTSARGRVDAPAPTPTWRQDLHLLDGWTPPAGPPAEPGRALITGAAGLLGLHLTWAWLATPGARVTCLVRAQGPSAARARLEEAAARHGLTLDWSRMEVLPGALASLRPGPWERVLHAAATTDLRPPYAALRTDNVEGTAAVLRLGRPTLYVSTAGAELGDEPLGPGYLMTKWVAERLVGVARARGLPVWVCRPGRLWGNRITGLTPSSDALWRLVEAGRVSWDDAVAQVEPVDDYARVVVGWFRASPPGDAALPAPPPPPVSLYRHQG